MAYRNVSGSHEEPEHADENTPERVCIGHCSGCWEWSPLYRVPDAPVSELYCNQCLSILQTAA